MRQSELSPPLSRWQFSLAQLAAEDLLNTNITHRLAVPFLQCPWYSKIKTGPCYMYWAVGLGVRELADGASWWRPRMRRKPQIPL